MAMATASKSGLSLLGAYSESDEDDDGPSLPPSAAPATVPAAGAETVDTAVSAFMSDLESSGLLDPSLPAVVTAADARTAEEKTQQEKNERVTDMASLPAVEVGPGDAERAAMETVQHAEIAEWQLVTDSSGQTYYWNTASGETAWEAPAGGLGLNHYSSGAGGRGPEAELPPGMEGSVPVMLPGGSLSLEGSVDHVGASQPLFGYATAVTMDASEAGDCLALGLSLVEQYSSLLQSMAAETGAAMASVPPSVRAAIEAQIRLADCQLLAASQFHPLHCLPWLLQSWAAQLPNLQAAGVLPFPPATLTAAAGQPCQGHAIAAAAAAVASAEEREEGEVDMEIDDEDEGATVGSDPPPQPPPLSPSSDRDPPPPTDPSAAPIGSHGSAAGPLPACSPAAVPVQDSSSHSTETATVAAPVVSGEVSLQLQAAAAARAEAMAAARTERKKGKSAAAKKLRTSKKVASMVEKWMAVKEKVKEEQSSGEEEEEEEDMDGREKRKRREIEEWKHSQLASGSALFNANFQPLGSDWRKRVKTDSQQGKEEKKGSHGPQLEALSKGLPAGWQAFWDASSAEVYYGNLTTKETSWDRPS